MERLITRTLAEIYLEQGHVQEAYEMYKILAERDPSNEEIRLKRKSLEERLRRDRSSQEDAALTSRACSDAERIRILKQWLTNIQERRNGWTQRSTIEE